jgi:hypothetical protein
MIFVGDVAVAHNDKFKFVNFPVELQKKHWSINLEGPVLPIDQTLSRGVYNSSNLMQSFVGFNVKSACLANNHIEDVPGGISKTLEFLNKQGISGFGAGANIKEASRVEVIEEEGLVLKAYGWSVIGCKTSDTTKQGVAPFIPSKILNDAKNILNDHPSLCLIIIIHGNYEFEPYPQPAHRELSLKLIDMGVHSVIYHHPHIVGPIEIYKGKCIAYSIGNWAFSYGHFFDKKLKFPSSSFPQLALELTRNKAIAHLANFSPDRTVEYISSEDVFSEGFIYRAKFEGMNQLDYMVWFKKNRIKRKGLPIYKSMNSKYFSFINDLNVKTRNYIISVLVRLNIKSHKRNG